jgi:hypothetical protein
VSPLNIVRLLTLAHRAHRSLAAKKRKVRAREPVSPLGDSRQSLFSLSAFRAVISLIPTHLCVIANPATLYLTNAHRFCEHVQDFRALLSIRPPDRNDAMNPPITDKRWVHRGNLARAREHEHVPGCHAVDLGQQRAKDS